jgi:hypothetical protein
LAKLVALVSLILVVIISLAVVLSHGMFIWPVTRL